MWVCVGSDDVNWPLDWGNVCQLLSLKSASFFGDEAVTCRELPWALCLCDIPLHMVVALQRPSLEVTVPHRRTQPLRRQRSAACPACARGFLLASCYGYVGHPGFSFITNDWRSPFRHSSHVLCDGIIRAAGSGQERRSPGGCSGDWLGARGCCLIPEVGVKAGRDKRALPCGLSASGHSSPSTPVLPSAGPGHRRRWGGGLHAGRGAPGCGKLAPPLSHLVTLCELHACSSKA